MKTITLKTDLIEKEIQVEAAIAHISRKSNIEHLANIINRSVKVNEIGSYESLLIHIVLKCILDGDHSQLDFDVILEKRGNLNHFTNDEEPPYLIEYEKIIVNRSEIAQNCYLEQLALLVTAHSNIYKITDSDFCEINPEKLLLNFSSYKDFEFGLFFRQFNQRLKIRESAFSKIYFASDNDFQIIKLYPINYTNDVFLDLKRDHYLTTNNLKSKLHNIKNGDLITSGTFDKINSLYKNDEELSTYMMNFWKEKIRKENDRDNNYDIHRTTDWSLYNDDFDPDVQNSDFWNQF